MIQMVRGVIQQIIVLNMIIAWFRNILIFFFVIHPALTIQYESYNMDHISKCNQRNVKTHLWKTTQSERFQIKIVSKKDLVMKR